MTIQFGVGKSNFADFRRADNYYVDKTEILYELVHETDNNVTLFTRPRRFGKTLMLSMMENFFNVRKDSRELFSGLDVLKHDSFCDKWMNQYPVLFVSFKDVEAETFEDAYRILQMKIAEVCKEYDDVFRESKVDQDDEQLFLKLKSMTAEKSVVKSALKIITRMLYAVYGKKAIVLVDEIDFPLARASEKNTIDNGYYREMVDLMRGVMSTTLKDNESLQFAVITGCLKIGKESVFTGTNNFVSYSVLDEDFSKYFGFSDREVAEILAAAGKHDKAELVKEWYDGYVFGNNHVYCPWDVMNYVSALNKRSDARPKNYWKNTSHNGILLSFVERTDFDVAGKFEQLLNGGTVYQTVSDELTYDSLHSSEENLWSVLLMTGYITKVDAEEDGETTELRIPNKEIASVFEDTVVEHFKNTVDTDAVNQLVRMLWDNDAEGATKVISDLLWNTISYHDYHEDYYHAFLAGIFVGRGYQVESNKEVGLGRPDILLVDRKNRRAIIIEAKRSSHEADMDADCDEALNQIVEKKYAEGLTGFVQILCFGISFYQKQAKMKSLLPKN
ncbi:MAG: AAA family ATPase [Solobacterium sp.]|nr:AAA family ATPase [Solobacterium sp.]